MYQEVQSESLESVIDQHGALVKRIAYHLMARLPSNVCVDDLIQAGMIGLLEAARNFDGTRGASFQTYAGIRVRGAMLDDLRKGDWAPRSVHKNTRLISKTIRDLENAHGREVKDKEIADHMGVSLTDYQSMLADTAGTFLLSTDEMLTEHGEEVTDTDAGDPLSVIQDEGFQKFLAGEISSLPEREGLVLSLYYEQELSLKDIGQVLGVSESRVSQIHSQAALRLRGRMHNWIN